MTFDLDWAAFRIRLGQLLRECGILLLTVLLLLGHSGCGQKNVATTAPEVPNDGPDVAKADQVERKTPEDLDPERKTESADDLASRNPPPQKTEARHKLAISKDFDWAEQARVKLAWTRLLARSDECFGDILAHIDDERYSITFSRLDVFDNYTVGDICLLIISKRLEHFAIDDPRVMAYYWARPAKDERRSWIEAHARNSLAELQLEGLHEMEQRFASPEYDAEREHFLKRIESLRETIKATGNPIPYVGPAFSTLEDDYDAIRFLSSRSVIVLAE